MNLSIFNHWSWQDKSLFLLRVLWVTTVLILMYQDEASFSFWWVFTPVILCNLIPFMLLKGRYWLYLTAEVVLCGGISILMAYEWGLTRLVLPSLFTIAFFTRGSRHGISFPISALLLIGSSGVLVNSAGFFPVFYQALFDAVILYGFSFALQKGSRGIESIRHKLSLIREQYAILEQYSSQIERMTLLEERYRLARELHDTIGHNFTSLILGMEALSKYISSPEGKTKSEKLIQLARTGLDDIRKQVHQMASPEEALPLDRTLMQIIDSFVTNAGVHVIFRSSGEPFPVMIQVKLALSRCLQEALTNASRHGHASKIQVVLHYDLTHLMLQIQDNGQGVEELHFGFGLNSMKERLTPLQGQLFVDSQVDSGTIITCTIPNSFEASNQPIHILLADDQPLVRESMRLLLGEEKDLELVVVEDGLQAITYCEKHQPDVVLMDIHMPKQDGIETARQIKASWPEVRIIMMTSIEDSNIALQALHLGAEGYLLKSIHPKELAASIRLIHGGGTLISQEIAQHLFHNQFDSEKSNPYELTDREIQVLKYLVEGLRNKEIALKLHLSEGTIRNYISSTYLKLQVASRTEAVEKTIAEGLI